MTMIDFFHHQTSTDAAHHSTLMSTGIQHSSYNSPICEDRNFKIKMKLKLCQQNDWHKHRERHHT